MASVTSATATEPRARQDAEARSNMYRFLSAVHLEPPTPQLLARLADPSFLDDLRVVFGARAVADLEVFAATRPVSDPATVTQDYMDLFAVPTGRYVTPFEDVYRGAAEGQQERGPLLGERAVAATRAYRQAGAQMDSACKALPTHIGVELSFMGFLCELEASAGAEMAGAWRRVQRKFLDEHLTAWFPQLSRAIRANAQTPVYRGLARITEEFLAMDTAVLAAASDTDAN